MKKIFLILSLIPFYCFSQVQIPRGASIGGGAPIDSVVIQNNVVYHYEGTTTKVRKYRGIILGNTYIDSISNKQANIWTWYPGVNNRGKFRAPFGIQFGNGDLIDSVHVDGSQIDSLYVGGVGYWMGSPLFGEFGWSIGNTLYVITSIEKSADSLFITVNDTAIYQVIGDSSLAFTNYQSADAPDTVLSDPYGISVFDDNTKIRSITEDTDTLNWNVNGWLFEIKPPVAPAFCAEYQTVYDEFLTPPDATEAAYQNTMVSSLVAGGYWARMDLFYVFANNNEANALLNWIAPTGDDNCTNQHSTVFTAYQGFTGNASTDYLNTNYNASTEGVHYLQNDATMGTYNRTALLVTNNYIMGAADDVADLWATFRPYFGAPASARCVLNDNYAGRYEPTISGSQGLVIITRNTVDVEIYFNGVSQGSTSNASAGIPNYNFFILAQNYQGSASGFITAEVSVAFVMDGISDAEATAINTIIETYMDAIGKGVE